MKFTQKHGDFYFTTDNFDKSTPLADFAFGVLWAIIFLISFWVLGCIGTCVLSSLQ